MIFLKLSGKRPRRSRKYAPRRDRQRGEPPGEAAALDEPHAEEALAVVLANLVDRDDSRMVPMRDRLDLVLEAAQFCRVRQQAGLDHLEGDGSVQADLSGLVNDPHAASAEFLLELVIAEIVVLRELW
jgi:hypothetical protein